MREIGEIYTFNGEDYELVEDNIIIEKRKKSFIIWMNVVALLIILVLSVIHLVFTYKKINSIDNILVLYLAFLGSFIAYIIIHELLHGWAFIFFGKVGKKNIKFGLVLKSGMAYCCSLVPVKISAGRLSLMMPVYVICIPIYIVSLIIGNPWLGIYAILLFSGSVGDLYYMWKLRHTSKDYYMYEELPTKSGYEVGYLLFKKL